MNGAYLAIGASSILAALAKRHRAEDLVVDSARAGGLWVGAMEDLELPVEAEEAMGLVGAMNQETAPGAGWSRSERDLRRKKYLRRLPYDIVESTYAWPTGWSARNGADVGRELFILKDHVPLWRLVFGQGHIWVQQHGRDIGSLPWHPQGRITGLHEFYTAYLWPDSAEHEEADLDYFWRSFFELLESKQIDARGRR